MKITKLSLASLVAASAITSLSASSLEDAVKNTEIDGQVRYRFEEKTDTNTSNNWRINFNTSTQINEDVKGNVGILVNANTYKTDANPDVLIQKVFFTYTGIDGLTAIVGKQELTSVFEDNKASGGIGATGTGLSVNYDFSGVELGLARYWNTSANGTLDVTTASLTTTVAGINLGAHAHVSTGASEMQRIAVLADTKIAVSEDVTVKINAAYSQVTKKPADSDGSLLRLTVKTNISGVNFGIGYAANGKDGAEVALNKDAKTNLRLHGLHMNNAGADATALVACVGTKVTSDVKVVLKYMGISDYKAMDIDASELLAKVSYKMSKNFKLSAFHSIVDEDNQDKVKKTRIEAKYTF